MSKDGISETAAEWLVRRRSGHWSDADERALAAWLAANPRHQREFEMFEGLWSELDQVRDRVVASQPPPRQTEPARTRRGVWGLAAACAALTLVVAGAVIHYRSGLPVHQQALVTGARQRLEARLPDGSRVALNVDSEAIVTYFRDRRDVALTRGEAFFAVARDPERTFLVRVRDVTVRVAGTEFNVYLAPAAVRVSVLEGSVEVTRSSTGSTTRVVLNPGQVARIAEHATISTVPASDVGAWRSGQVVFRDRPLREVLMEVGRYRARPIVLADSRLGDRRLSGVLSVNNPEGFLDALPQILPLRVSRDADGTVTIMGKE